MYILRTEPGILEEQSVFPTPEPSLQPLVAKFKKKKRKEKKTTSGI